MLSLFYSSDLFVLLLLQEPPLVLLPKLGLGCKTEDSTPSYISITIVLLLMGGRSKEAVSHIFRTGVWVFVASG